MRALTLLATLLCSAVDGLSLGQRLGAVRSSGARYMRDAALLAEARPTLAAARAAASLAPAAAMLAHVDVAYAAARMNGAAAAADVAFEPPVPDGVVVGVALLLVGACGLLQLSLGDIQAQEAQLPSSVSLINKNRLKNNSFIRSSKKRS